MYKAPTIHKPSKEEVKSISEELGLHLDEEEVTAYHRMACQNLESVYSKLEEYVEPHVPIKYPRTPGYRPPPEENQYNAWYRKSTIAGAPNGRLKGLLVVIKDSIPVAGVPMIHGSRVMEGYVPDYDPTIVTRVLDEGATIVGKATCEDFCVSGSSIFSHPAPVLNPYDTTCISGGSSSGCAVLVQNKEADVALGADQGGSIRVPCSWTGLVGLKPTYGLVPYTGIPSLAVAVDSAGPMARTVQDCATLLEVIAGYDGGLDPRQSVDIKVPKYTDYLTGDLSGMKIGLLKEGFTVCDTDIRSIVFKAAKLLQEKGADLVEEMSVPMHKDAIPVCSAADIEGIYQCVVRSAGFPVGPPSFYPTSAIDNYTAYLKTRMRDVSPPVKKAFIIGKYVYDNYGLHFYAKSMNLIRLLRDQYNDALGKYDVIIMPTTLKNPPKIPAADTNIQDILQVFSATELEYNTLPFNATGHPALTINAGYSQGLPVGMQIVGKHWDEKSILKVAHAFEQLRDKAVLDVPLCAY